MNESLRKIFTNFSKGLNLSVSHMIDSEELQVADNFLFRGKTEVREGTVLNAVLSAPVMALKKHYKRDGDSYIFAVAGNKAYVSRTSGVFVNISCETIASGDVSVTAYDDFVYFTNLSTCVKTCNGSSVDNAGLSSPQFVKKLGDWEAVGSWTVTNGSVTETATYLNIDEGDKAIVLHGQAGQVCYITSESTVTLTTFSSGVPSTVNDSIQIFVNPAQKANVQYLNLAFVYGATYAVANLAALSSWVYCSNDSWSMTHTVPKAQFITTSGFSWDSACRIRVEMVAVNASAAVAMDHLRMVRTPPIVQRVNVTGGGLYFGYNHGATDRFTADIPAVARTQAVWNTAEGTAWSVTSSVDANGISMDGTTYWKVTFVKPGPGGVEIESNPTYQTSGVVLSSYVITSAWLTSTVVSTNIVVGSIGSLTNIPVAPSNLGVVARKVYRRNRTESVMRHVRTIADNTTTTLLDNVPYAVLGEVLDDDRYPPPRAKFIYAASSQQTYYLNITEEDGKRHGSRVRFSRPYTPHYVPVDNVFDVSPNDGYEITGCFEYMNLLHILKGGSAWLLDGGNLTQVHKTYGCIAPKSIAIGPGEVFWLADEGIVKYNLRFKNITVEDNKIASLLENLDRTKLQTAAGIYYRGLYLLALNIGSGSYNNTVLCYDNISEQWSIFPNMQVNCWDVWSGAKDGYRLFYGNVSGRVCEFLTGETDFGQPIPWAARTKEFGNPTPTTTLRYVWLYTKSVNNSGQQVNLTPYFDFVEASGDIISVTSGYKLSKAVFPAANDAGFISIGMSGAGRIQLIHLDEYEKEESLR